MTAAIYDIDFEYPAIIEIIQLFDGKECNEVYQLLRFANLMRSGVTSSPEI